MSAQADEPVFYPWRVSLRSTPGMYAQYDGDVTVWSASADADELFTRAVQQLARTSFPDRARRDFWRHEGAERLP